LLFPLVPVEVDIGSWIQKGKKQSRGHKTHSEVSLRASSLRPFRTYVRTFLPGCMQLCYVWPLTADVRISCELLAVRMGPTGEGNEISEAGLTIVVSICRQAGGTKENSSSNTERTAQ
jgi:hypothetical protein